MGHPRLTHLHASDYHRTPWKNGLGHTDQIAIHPPGADLRQGNYDWRVSTARVAQSAPFSVFPEHDRILVILKGNGVTLSHEFVPGEERETVEVPLLEPYEFPGDVPTQCDLRSGPIQDFSVFIRKGEVSAIPDAALISSDQPYLLEIQAKTCFLFAASGILEVNDFTLQAGDTLRIELEDGPTEEPLIIRSQTPQSQLLTIQLDSAG